MPKNENNTIDKSPFNKLWGYIKKNSFTILMTIFIITLLISPDAKSFVLRQLMMTGLFNASIDKKESNISVQANTDFSFTEENGAIQHTSTLRGKVVFINFWASWCPPCRAEFPSIETLYTKFKDNPDIFFLTINEDQDLAAGKAYLSKENFSIPIYRSYGNVPTNIYSGTLPTTVILDKEGKMRFRHTGFANYASNKFINQMEALMNE